MVSTAALVEEVLAAAGRGESLIAVGADKRPWYSWKRYQSERAGDAQLLTWSKDRRTTAFASVTGAISGFVVVDFDEDGVRLIEDNGLDPHVRTGRGGYHLRVEHPGFRVATQNSKVTKLLAERWPGLDIRGDGGYAIEYGASAHGAYEHLRDLTDFDPISALPEDMAAALGLLGPEALEELVGEVSSTGEKAQRAADGTFHTGHRHRHLLEVASAMAGRGHREAEILAELRRINPVDCTPAKDDDQLVELARDAARRYGTERPAPADLRRQERERLETLLRLAQDGLHITELQLDGNGSTAELEIWLSNGHVIQAERFGDLWTHTGLAKFITQTTGINASGITKVEAGEANALIRRLAGYARRAATAGDLGTDHGVDFLRRADCLSLDVTNQAERYAAWSRLDSMDPVRASDPRLYDRNATLPATIADASLVLEHIDGTRLVRCDWLYAHVKRAGEVAGPNELVKRMEHAGWTRRNKRGSIKATSPGFGPPITLAFWIVPAGWEDDL